MKYLTVSPAYGRDYRSKKEVQAAWDAGQDFIVQDIMSGGYVSKNDSLPEGTVVMARYARMTKIAEIKR